MGCCGANDLSISLTQATSTGSSVVTLAEPSHRGCPTQNLSKRRRNRWTVFGFPTALFSDWYFAYTRLLDLWSSRGLWPWWLSTRLYITFFVPCGSPVCMRTLGCVYKLHASAPTNTGCNSQDGLRAGAKCAAQWLSSLLALILLMCLSAPKRGGLEAGGSKLPTIGTVKFSMRRGVSRASSCPITRLLGGVPVAVFALRREEWTSAAAWDFDKPELHAWVPRSRPPQSSSHPSIHPSIHPSPHTPLPKRG